MQFKMLKIMNDVIESQMISILTALVAWHTGAVGLPTGEACPRLENIHVWYTRRYWFRFTTRSTWINLASITNILPGKFALSWDFKYPGMNSVWKKYIMTLLRAQKRTAVWSYRTGRFSCHASYSSFSFGYWERALLSHLPIK